MLSPGKKLLAAEAMWTRYMPFSKTIREIVDSGAIGKPAALNANLGYTNAWRERIQRPELAGGALLDLGVYPISFPLMVFGTDIAEVTAVCTVIPRCGGTFRCAKNARRDRPGEISHFYWRQI